ncbi:MULTISPECIES: helix-turn-helix domain-containing protein [unclassified Rhizobium]|uniref:helix-turn-helix domain-containing protein n=1 Tax=unclassified Rhizobium TaxID=2613769 RepID=UPI0038D476B7
MTEAAAYLAISKKTLLRHVIEGQLGCVNVGTEGRMHRRFTTSQLTAFISQRQTFEVSRCLSTRQKPAHFIGTTSRSTAIAFTELPRPGIGGRQSR